MPGLVPGIHAETSRQRCRTGPQRRGVDGRDKPSHDVRWRMVVKPAKAFEQVGIMDQERPRSDVDAVTIWLTTVSTSGAALLLDIGLSTIPNPSAEFRRDPLSIVMPLFEIIDGLPPYGEQALPFPSDGSSFFKEGLVVRVHDEIGTSWIGNFQRGLSNYDIVCRHPDGEQLVVVAGGDAFVIDPTSRRATHRFGGAIYLVRRVENPNLLLFSDATKFEALLAGRTWISARISWDGFRSITVDGAVLHAEAWSAPDEEWRPFSLDLLTGKSSSSIYHSDLVGAIMLGESPHQNKG